MKSTTLSTLLFVGSSMVGATFLSHSSYADESPTVYGTAQEEAIRGTPGGSQIGSVRGGAAMKMLEQRGDWMRVSVEGWVKAANISQGSPQPAGAKPVAAGPVPDNQLVPVDFQIESLTPSGFGDRARVKITVKIKNASPNVASNWTALLVAQTPSGEILARTKVANGKDPIPPSSVGEVIYYWGETEDGYDKLVNKTKEDLRLSFYQVKFE